MNLLFNKPKTNDTYEVYAVTPRRCMTVLMIAVMIIGIGMPGFAQEWQKKEDPFRMKTISGEVISKTRANFSIAFEADETGAVEAIMPYGEKTKLLGYKSMVDMKRGDQVRVEAKQSYVIDKDGNEVITGTFADTVTLTRPSTASGRLSVVGGAR